MKKTALALAMVFVFCLSPLLTIPAQAAAPVAGYGQAVVDGDYSEWNLTNDFFANMYNAGDSSKELFSKLYLRYDCSQASFGAHGGTLYALVLVNSPQPNGSIVTVDTTGDAYIKLGNTTKLLDKTSGNDGTPPDFSWIVDGGGNTIGWEGSIYLSQGTLTNFNVHTQVLSNGATKTSRFNNVFLTLTTTCGTDDFGDLPSLYDSITLLPNGAHNSLGNLYLGAGISGENNGQPSPTASLDTFDDGVVPVPGTGLWLNGTGTVNVTVTGGSGCLTAWIDFWNHYTSTLGPDGDFIDSGVNSLGQSWNENIIPTTAVNAGVTPFTFNLPDGVGTVPVFARFRIVPQNGDGSCPAGSLTGGAINGEVEDYQFYVDPNPLLDYGDLPDSTSGGSPVPDYNITTLAENGARHSPGNLYLGTQIDTEVDGQPNAAANGDDVNPVGGPNDEDGVAPVKMAAGKSWWAEGQGKVDVTVTGPADTKGCLTAWMDFWDGATAHDVGTDGDFADYDTAAGWNENIIPTHLVDAGPSGVVNTFTFTLPTGAATVPAYARFRLVPAIDNSCDFYTSGSILGLTSQMSSVTPINLLTGFINNGETEDYLYFWDNSTAVTLSNFKASPVAGASLPLAAVASVLGMGGLGLYIGKRRH